MKKILPFLVLIIYFTSCNILEDEIIFNDVQDPNKTKYQITLIDTVNVKDYTIYKNDVVFERHVFDFDSLNTKKIVYDANNSVKSKRYYYFSPDNYKLVNDTSYINGSMVIDTIVMNINNFIDRKKALSTIDSIYYQDSILVRKSAYSYSKMLLVEARITEQTLNSNQNSTFYYYKYYYNNDKNKLKENFETDFGICSNEYLYSTEKGLLDLDKFENALLGSPNNNLISNVFWEKSCKMSEHEIKPTSTYSYEFDALGLVTKRTEIYANAYMEFVGTEVQRDVRVITYEYQFQE